MPLRTLARATLAAPFALLAACGGGGGDAGTGTAAPPPGSGGGTGGGTGGTATPGGIYAGTLRSEVQAGSFNLIGAATEAGVLQLVNTTNGFQYSGQLAASGASTSLRVYDNTGAFLTTGSFSGTITSRSQITGTYTTANGDRGSITVNYNSLYATPTPLTTVAGNYRWTSTRNGGASTLTVNASGALSGTTEFGCAFTGTIALADSRFNLFNVSIQTPGSSACGVAASSILNGLAYYTPASGGMAAGLTAAVSTTGAAYYADYRRQ